jgi:hypothetical protein
MPKQMSNAAQTPAPKRSGNAGKQNKDKLAHVGMWENEGPQY